MTREQFLAAIRDVAAARLNAGPVRERLMEAKLVYGAGNPGVRGTCFYDSWEKSGSLDFIEVSASGEESLLQLVGTTIHELAHCVAGRLAGHGYDWKSAARALGLIRAQAAGQTYTADDFDPALLAFVQSLPEPADGRPRFSLSGRRGSVARPCGLGLGTKGGRSRGPGSGSRLRLFVCACVPPVRLRAARAGDSLRVRCLDCGEMFRRVLQSADMTA